VPDRTHLRISNLEAYFADKNLSFEDLQGVADELFMRYFSTEAYDRAMAGGGYACESFVSGIPWSRASEDGTEPFTGDKTLANSILRMRDSMLHYEFQSAVADGDIGHAMNVMAVSIHEFY